MSFRSLLVRIVCQAILAAWVGGFMFYGGVVIPALHDAIGVPDTAAVTRVVTNWLNGLGAASLGFWIPIHLIGLRRPSPRWERPIRSTFLAGSLALLLVLIVLHRRMDLILDAGADASFHRLHRLYLMASTAQWLANLGLMGLGPGDYWPSTTGPGWRSESREPSPEEAMTRRLRNPS